MRRRLLAFLVSLSLIMTSLGGNILVFAAEEPDIPVLLYHRILSVPSNEWTDTSIVNFTKTMKYLDDNGYTTLTAEQYVAIMDGSALPADIPAKPILLTFDDATPDFIENTLPTLNVYGMNAVLFVITDWIGGGYSMSLAHLEGLAANNPNISIQNHSVYHADNVWNSMTEEAASAELAQANTFIKGITGKDPVLFAFPYGHYNSNVQTAAAENGLKYSFKVGYPNAGDHAMGRHYVQMGTTLSNIASWIGGPAPASEDTGTSDTVTVYKESFTDGQGLAVQSGGATLSAVTGKVFDGNIDGAALYVSSRSNDYDAADFSFTDLGLVNGKEYTVTVTGFVDAEIAVTTGAQVVLSAISSYTWLSNKDVVAGSAFTLTSTFTVDTSKDTKLRVQSNADGVTVPFYIGEVLITEMVTPPEEEPEPDRDPALPFTTITFEDQGLNGFAGRAGTETLTVTEEANHTADGSYALKVEDRTNTWHAPALRVEKYIDKGYEYNISVWVKLISPQSSQLQVSTQVGNSSPSYNNIGPATISTEDGWVQLKGTYRYTSVGDEFVSIYVESSNNSTASFYIDDISFEKIDSGLISIQDDLTPIKEVYKDDFLIGNATSSADLEGVRLDLLKLHHNVITAENAMKPGELQPTKGAFTFDGADAIVNKALAEDIKVHGHVLVWHQQSPEWMNMITDSEPLSREEALENMRTHIKSVMEHFGDKVISWDVVNEAMNDNPSNPTQWKGALRQCPWKQAIGDDYIEQAFLAAREVLDQNPEWDIKLYYNDYNDDNQNKAQAIYSMVKEINDKYAEVHAGKLLIDGVGMQAHYNINTNPENVKLSLEKFISLGVEVSITELDIQAGSNSVLSDKQAMAQGYLYAQLFKLYKEHAEDIARVTLWGLNDATSWRAATCPLLFDKDLQSKPAYDGVIDPDTFMASHVIEDKDVKQSTAANGTPVVDGVVDAIWSTTPQMQINQYQMAWQGATGVAKALWDSQYLYVLIQVSDAQLDKNNTNAWEQDCVEIFLDQNNAKSTSYEDDDGQYRVNFDNETSFSPAGIAEGFMSATKVSGANYIVEAKIPLTAITPVANLQIGFDVQINDAKDGARQSVAAWNDTAGTGYMDTSVYGVVTLTPKAGSSTNPGSTNSDNSNSGSVNSGSSNPATVPTTGSVNVSTSVIDNLISKGLSTGEMVITVDIPEGSAASITIPLSNIQQSDITSVAINTKDVSISIDKGNLPKDGKAMTLGIIEVPVVELPESVRNMIGNNRVYNFNLTVDGQKITEFEKPIKVSFKYNLSEGQDPNTVVIYYLNDKGNLEIVTNGRYDATTGLVTFTTDHFSKYFATNRMIVLKDVSTSFWAKNAIYYTVSRDIMKGAINNTFEPNVAMTRGELIQAVVSAYELKTKDTKTSFTDVEVSNEYYDAISIAKELGIISGYTDNTFRPNLTVSRQEFAQIIYSALKVKGLLNETIPSAEVFVDADEVAPYALKAIAELRKYGYIMGYLDNTFRPTHSVTKAEGASLLAR